MEDDEPLDVLEFWYLWWDVPPESPPLSPQATDSDLEPSARGRLALIPSADVERTDPDSDLEPSARGRLAHISSGNAERTDPDTGPRSCDEEYLGSGEEHFPHSGGEAELGQRAPVTPPWPEGRRRSRSPLPRRRRSSPAGGTHQAYMPQPRGENLPLGSDPRVYRGRTKEQWKIESKLRYRAQRQQKRRAKAAAEPSSDRWGRRG